MSYWVNRIASEARLLGHQVMSLTGGEASESNLKSVLESFEPTYAILGGHGSATVFTGMNLSPLLVACQNDEMLEGTQSLFVSCLTGISLVPSVVSKGGVAAAGFTSEFTWVVSPPYIPATDPYAAPFERMIVEPATVVLRGGSWADWYAAIQRVKREEEAKWGVSDDVLASDVIYCLRHNAGAATFMGAGVVRAGMGPLLLVPLLWWLLKGK